MTIPTSRPIELADELQRRLGTRELFPLSFGYSGLDFFAPEHLVAGQIGYSVAPDGHDLTGNDDGDWRAGWLVIGYESNLGDPIFADTAAAGWPIYTAMHGDGRWDPTPVADSLESFLAAMAAVRRVALERSTPSALEENPLAPAELRALLATIAAANPRAGAGYWKVWLE